MAALTQEDSPGVLPAITMVARSRGTTATATRRMASTSGMDRLLVDAGANHPTTHSTEWSTSAEWAGAPR